MVRKYKLEEALDQVLRRSRLRRPQRESLIKFHELMLGINGDFSELSQQDFADRLREERPDWQFNDGLPAMTCALATGVGKTRLIGAMIAYLYLSGQARNFCLIASRAEVVRKLVEECYRGSRKYIFGDDALVPEPEVWHAENLDRFQSLSLLGGGDDGLNIFVISPQALVGDKRKAWAVSEFSGTSPAGYLQAAKDLVVFVDEAHHVGGVADDVGSAWAQGLAQLAPRMMIGMTATPRSERGTNLLYSYDLPTCLREGLYTKSVTVIVEKRSDAFNDVEWDRHTLEFALDRLHRKVEAIKAAKDASVHVIKPVLLVCAEDTAHADEVGSWLVDSRGFAKDEVLVVHSKRAANETDIQRLLDVESPTNPVRIVVNVQKLTEGWDVSNVYVIAPLRAMGTFAGAVQAMGRGLRLPVGRRIGDPDIDGLDVLCFGRTAFEDILKQALKEFGGEGLGVTINEASSEPPQRIEKSSIALTTVKSVEVEIPTAERVLHDPDLDFNTSDLSKMVARRGAEFELAADGKVSKSSELRYEWEVFVRQCVARIVAGLPYLSAPLHSGKVRSLVTKALLASGATEGGLVSGDWVRLGEAIKERIDGSFRRLPVEYSTVAGARRLAFDPVEISVDKAKAVPIDQKSISSWVGAYERRPIGGWSTSVYSSAIFDGKPEFLVARILDRDADVDWWLRNDPPQFRIATPIGGFEPDFLVKTKAGKMVVIEVKGGTFWQAPDSDARVKSQSAHEWCEKVSISSAWSWEMIVVLDTDVPSATTLEDLRSASVSGNKLVSRKDQVAKEEAAIS